MENSQKRFWTFPYLTSSFESRNPQIKIPSLKSISATCIASEMWKNPILKNGLIDIFLSRQALFPKLEISGIISQKELNEKENSINVSHEKYVRTTISSAKKILKAFDLPVMLNDYCLDVLTIMGDEIVDWFTYVVEILKFDFKFCEKIYWTPNGKINENKIFKSWENDEEFARQKNLKAPASYFLACINVRKDFIVKHQSDMERIIREHEPEFDLSNLRYYSKVYILIASYLFCLENNKFIPMTIFYGIASPFYMAITCANLGLIKAAFYFWHYCCVKNNNDFGLVWIRELGELCLRNFKIPPVSRYQIRNQTKFLIFLINVLNDEQKNKFFTDETWPLFCKMVNHYPLHEITSELVENYFLKFSRTRWKWIFRFFFCLKKYNTVLRLNSRINESHQVFQKLFMKVPDDLKYEVFSIHVISRVFKDDFKCFKIIISNMDENTRSNVIKSIQPKILLLIKEGEIERLNEFMNDLLISESEKTSCKNYILGCFSEILKNETIVVVGKLFDCLSLTEEEKATLKNRLNCFEMGKVIISTWGTFKRFVNWYENRRRAVCLGRAVCCENPFRKMSKNPFRNPFKPWRKYDF